jgi:hypothetical protein
MDFETLVEVLLIEQLRDFFNIVENVRVIRAEVMSTRKTVGK